ncbi:GNAT family N-acetyltransferase [Streptomyces sp. SID14478]|uniref:GNAT family N-acetyltransferase n=1 Tax=Streptomyces sp. SID14478 TaxID=2706073 RepID=UPI0013DB0C6B|nr:GNAT family N-acetyltransferase [Streptomyces sp. SID14478]NEB74834.1 GNAT family N-acetyltransferase [Streptomyces sp. SID14478]
MEQQTVRIRPGRPEEAARLSALALRSKAHWGYDADFMEACVAELTLEPGEVEARRTAVAESGDGRLLGLVTLEGQPPQGELGLMFVAPEAIGGGVGRLLFDHLREAARAAGFTRISWAADPNALPFYEAMGGRRSGSIPSGSVAGRVLPLMELDLRRPAATRSRPATPPAAG